MRDDRLDITELERRLANLVRIGTVASVDPAAARATVAIGDVTTAALPWTVTRAGADRDWTAPAAGEQVLVVAVGGDLAQGVILGGLFADAAPAPADSGEIRRTTYADGAEISYDSAAHALTATLPGGATITAQGDFALTAAGTVTITAPSVRIVGDLAVEGKVSATGSILDAGGNSNHHSH
ncbi:MAG: hypothetical protein RLZZ501_2257 [Pseudomonadota bacterium]|jgi:phage baseplate assembly protein V